MYAYGRRNSRVGRGIGGSDEKKACFRGSTGKGGYGEISAGTIDLTKKPVPDRFSIFLDLLNFF